MGVRFERRKPRNLIVSAAYRLHRLVGPECLLNLLLDLEWIARRLAHSCAFRAGYGQLRRNNFLVEAIKPSERVLDLGCGDGSTTSGVHAHVVGVDHSLEMIEIARKAYPNGEFIRADAKEYLRSAEKFDVLILSHVLEHLDDPATLLSEVARRFRKIYVEVPDFEADLLNQVRKDRGTIVYTDEDHVAEFDRSEIEELFAQSGLKVINREFIYGNMRFWLSAASKTPDKSDRQEGRVSPALGERRTAVRETQNEASGAFPTKEGSKDAC